MTGWLIYGAIFTIATLVFIGVPLVIRLNGYQGRHVVKKGKWIRPYEYVALETHPTLGERIVHRKGGTGWRTETPLTEWKDHA